MAMVAEAKQEIVGAHRRHKSDTGSTQVQVALITARIEQLTGHMKVHKKDHSTRRGLLALVAQRRKLLDYLKRDSPQQYQELIAKLGLRK
ncbi:MAG: 30S ribosomal protein S15 [Bryobacter sp.]|nr:30S ribosomal protein S15 [Bryobacter sp.]